MKLYTMKLPASGVAAFAFALFAQQAANAQDATWVGNATRFGSFTDPTEWTPAQVPIGIAVFGPSSTTVITMATNLNIGTLQLNADAPAYAFQSSFNFNDVQFTGAGIVNKSSHAPSFLVDEQTLDFYNSSSAANSVIFNSNGAEFFHDQSTAANATIYNLGVVAFYDASSAGNAAITNNSGQVWFGASFGSPDTATAANATIFSDHGAVSFYAFSTAGNATLTFDHGGEIDFRDHSTGGQARLSLSGQSTADFSFTTGPNDDGKITIGSIEGTGTFMLGADQLTVGGNNLSTTVLGNITDGGLNGGTGGSLVKVGSGVLTLAGINTYTGDTTVNAGSLFVTGKIAKVNVSSGATLSGTGTVATTTIASGGTLTPGSGSVPGILTVAGNLTLAAGANYVAALTPSAVSLANVTGSGSVNGNLQVNAATGPYVAGQRYTLISASGGLSGTFSIVTVSGLPFIYRASVGYDPSHVFVTVNANTLSPLSSGASLNQKNVAAAIDAAVSAGVMPANGFAPLYNLSGTARNDALDQISGQIGPNLTHSVSQTFAPFLNLLLSQAAAGGGDTLTAQNFAPDSPYDMTGAPTPARLTPSETRVWGSAYGGHAGISADAATGAASLSANNVGLVAGAELQVQDDLGVGASIAIGRQLFSSGNGKGDSNDAMLGLYARKGVLEHGYIAASFGYGWHGITVTRLVTLSGADVLVSRFQADQFGGRIEGGYQLALDGRFGLTPYAAFVVERFETPAYAENPVSGASTFALSYAAQGQGLGQSELGARLGSDYNLDDTKLTAIALAGWAHRLDSIPFSAASFRGLPGSVFQAQGVSLDSDTILLGLSLVAQNTNGISYGFKMDGQVGARTTLIEGIGNLAYRW